MPRGVRHPLATRPQESSVIFFCNFVTSALSLSFSASYAQNRL